MPYLIGLYDASSRLLGSASATGAVTTIDLTFLGTGITGDIHYLRIDNSTVDFEVNKIEFYDGSWTEYTSDTYWADSPSLTTGVWDTDHWDAQEDGTPGGAGNPRILLYDIYSAGSGWWVRPSPSGYRPTQMRVTLTGAGLDPTPTSLSGSGTAKITFTEVSIWADSDVVWLDGDIDWYSGLKYPNIVVLSGMEALTWTISYVYPSAAVTALQPKVIVTPRRM